MASGSDEKSSTGGSTEELAAWQPTVRQQQLIKQTWSNEFADLYDLGARIYVYIFEQAPVLRHMFPDAQKAAARGDDYQNNAAFRSQTLKFVQTLAQAVNNIGHPERFQQILQKVGRAHCRFVARGFDPAYWNVFPNALEAALVDRVGIVGGENGDDGERLETVHAWRLLSNEIIKEMKIGFLAGMPTTNGNGGRR